MRRSTNMATGVIALLLYLVSPTTAEFKTFTITSDYSSRPVILLDKFWFTYIDIKVSSVSFVMPPSQLNHSKVGLFLLSQEEIPQLLTQIQLNLSLCLLDSRHVLVVSTFRHQTSPFSTIKESIFLDKNSGYCLFLVNCAPGSSVSMTVHTKLFDLDFDKDYFRNYLSSGQTLLPSLFFLFSTTYFAFLAVWLYLCHVSKRPFLLIHLSMALLLVAKAVSFICAAKVKLNVRTTGTPHGCDVFFFFFDFLHVVLLFTVILLVGTRWIFLHPIVQKRGKKMLFVIFPLQVLAYVAYVVVKNTGPYIKDWVILNQVLLLLDFISCCALVLLFFWNVRSLRKIAAKTNRDGEDGVNLDKVKLIKRFYCLVVGYFFVTRFVLFALQTVFIHEKQWMNNLVKETITLVFCILMFCVFRLAEKDEFSLIGKEEEEVAEVLLMK